MAKSPDMPLRRNPCTLFHRVIAKRTVLHIDAFAYWREDKSDQIIFALEFRDGGRGELSWPTAYFKATIGSDALEPATGREARWYDLTDRVRFNTRSGERWHDWARDLHHDALLPAFRDYFDRPGYSRHSFLAHYWHAYDLPPFGKDFINHFGAEGRGRKKA